MKWGGDISQKGDGNKGGEKYITGKGMVPQLKSNAKDKHYTVLELTALSGDPVMCVVIFAGTRENRLWETGIDSFAETEGDVSDDDYFQKTVERTNDSLGDLPAHFKARKYHV